MADFDDYFGDLMDDEEPEQPTASTPSTPRMEAVVQHPTPAADEKEAQADYAPDRETTVAKPLSRQLIPREEANKVHTVVSSELVKSLGMDGEMDADQVQRCRAVMGFAPVDIMDPSVQQQLIQRNRHLESAFENPMTKSFAIGVNYASTTLCKSILLITIARNLLDNTLQAMDLQSDNRPVLVDMAVEIQESMDKIADKAQSFVMMMAETIKEMGQTALALEYEADPQQLLRTLDETQTQVEQNKGVLEDDEKSAKTSIQKGYKEILSNLQKESAFADQEETVRQKREAFEEAEKKLHEAYHQQYTEQTKLLANDKSLEVQIASCSAAKATKEQAHAQQTQELEQMKQLRLDCVLKKDEIINDSFDETQVPGLEDVPALIARLASEELDVSQYTDLTRGQQDLSELQAAASAIQQPVAAASNAEFKRAFQQMMRNEVAARERVLDARIQRLEGVERQTERDAQRFREESKLASDGYTSQDTGNFLSLWNQTTGGRKNTICADCNKVCHMGCSSSSTNGCYVMTNGSCDKCNHRESRHVLGIMKSTSELRRTGTNERERLQKMAADLDETLKSLRAELTQLRTEKGTIKQKVMQDMKHIKDQQAEEEKQTQAREQERVDFLNKQNQEALARAEAANTRIKKQNAALLADMNTKNDAIRQRNEAVLDAAQNRNKQLIDHAVKVFTDNQNKELDMLNKQIDSIDIMISAVTQRKTHYEVEIGELGKKIADYTREREENERAREATKKDAGKIGALKSLESAEEAARLEYEHEREVLKDLVQRFGIRSGQDFATFMQMFSLLAKSIHNLPLAMKNLSGAFDAAKATFSGEYFEKNLGKIPKKNHGKMMKRVAIDIQSICEVGWNLFSGPINGLIDSDAKALLAPLMQMEMDRRAITAGGANDAIVEEVDDEVNEAPEVPRRSA